jgi:hypothetical protein
MEPASVLACSPRSDIQVHDFEGVILDELRRASTFSPISVVKIPAATASSSFTLAQGARVRVHGRVPQLLGVHFAQALESRDGEIFLASSTT